MSEQITLNKLYDNSEEIKSRFNKDLYKSIMKDYMNLIFESVLEGNVVNLLNDLGRFYISVSKRKYKDGPKKVDWGNSKYKIIDGKRDYYKLAYHNDPYPIFVWKKGMFKNKKKFRFRLTKGVNYSKNNKTYLLGQEFKKNPQKFYLNDEYKIKEVRVYNEHGAYLYSTSIKKLPDNWATIKKYIDPLTKEGKYKDYIYKIVT